MKKAFTVSGDTMVSAVSSSDLQLNSLQRLQQPGHCRPAEANGHDMMALGLQRASYEAEQERGKYDTGRRSEAERRHERLKGREYEGEEASMESMELAIVNEAGAAAQRALGTPVWSSNLA